MAPRTSEQFEELRNESRTKIMVAALELFAIDGYYNTSISKIAKHANVSKGLMYNYFDSKEELLIEVVTMSFRDAEQETQGIHSSLANKSPKEVLKTLFEMFFKLLEKNKIMWKLTMSLAMQVSNIKEVEAIITKIFDTFLEQLKTVMKLNGFKDYEVEAKLLAAQLDGIVLHSIIFEKTYNLEKVKNKLINKYCK